MFISERLTVSGSQTHCLRQSPCHCSSQQSTKSLVAWIPWADHHRVTYQWPQQVLLVLLELFQCILIVPCALDNLRGAALANVLQDCLHLVDSWGVFGNVELKLVTAALGIVSSIRLSACGRLLQQIGNSHRGWGASLVEERDNVERLVLYD